MIRRGRYIQFTSYPAWFSPISALSYEWIYKEYPFIAAKKRERKSIHLLSWVIQFHAILSIHVYSMREYIIVTLFPHDVSIAINPLSWYILPRFSGPRVPIYTHKEFTQTEVNCKVSNKRALLSAQTFVSAYLKAVLICVHRPPQWSHSVTSSSVQWYILLSASPRMKNTY